MAALLTLDEAKLHCRIDTNDEDSLLGALIATATTAVAEPVPAPVKSAALLLVGALYENRESMGERPFHKNPAFEALLNPYRVHA